MSDSTPENGQPDAPPAVTVWFDSDCPLCVREIALMRRLDRRGRIAFVDAVSDAEGCPLDPQTLLARFHAQERGGELVSGAAAFAAMWRAIPVLRPIGELARLAPVLWALERLYRGFLRVRPRLQALVRRRVEGAGPVP
ncbi:MAG: DUF393 domain-containing protein [Pseudomonadota bacterium]